MSNRSGRNHQTISWKFGRKLGTMCCRIVSKWTSFGWLLVWIRTPMVEDNVLKPFAF